MKIILLILLIACTTYAVDLDVVLMVLVVQMLISLILLSLHCFGKQLKLMVTSRQYNITIYGTRDVLEILILKYCLTH